MVSKQTSGIWSVLRHPVCSIVLWPGFAFPLRRKEKNSIITAAIHAKTVLPQSTLASDTSEVQIDYTGEDRSQKRTSSECTSTIADEGVDQIIQRRLEDSCKAEAINATPMIEGQGLKVLLKTSLGAC